MFRPMNLPARRPAARWPSALLALAASTGLAGGVFLAPPIGDLVLALLLAPVALFGSWRAARGIALTAPLWRRPRPNGPELHRLELRNEEAVTWFQGRPRARLALASLERAWLAHSCLQSPLEPARWLVLAGRETQLAIPFESEGVSGLLSTLAQRTDWDGLAMEQARDAEPGQAWPLLRRERAATEAEPAVVTQQEG